jgi:hypothetical protein
MKNLNRFLVLGTAALFVLVLAAGFNNAAWCGDHPTEHPKAEKPKVEQPKAEEHKDEHPKAEQQKAEHPKAEEQKDEHPKAEHPE